MTDKIRIGVVGAGSFTRSRSLPGFRKLEDAEVVAVANRSLASAEAVAQEFAIPDAYDDWHKIVERDDIDVVFIGAPPYVHLEVAAAAMESGKDVLSQTRMSRTLVEARQMQATAAATGRKAGLVRPSRFVSGGRYVKHLLDTDYIGKVRQVWYFRLIPDYTDASLPMGRRQDPDLYGLLNCLYLGYGWDVLQAWFGEAKRVFAQSLNFTPQRKAGPDGPMITVLTPEAITAIAEMENGASITSVQSGVAFFGEDRVEIYGDKGTIVYTANGDQITAGRKGDKELIELTVPDDWKDNWTVERDFVRWVQGEQSEFHPDFADGVKNIEYMEACYRSGKQGVWVDLPLS